MAKLGTPSSCRGSFVTAVGLLFGPLAVAAQAPLGREGGPARALRGAGGTAGAFAAAATPGGFLGESVECSMGTDTASLLLLTSTGLGTWGPDNSLTPIGHLEQAFRDMVLRLPDSAWEEDGAAKKQRARGRDVAALAKEHFREPELYSGLDAVILEDPCFLKDSFWNSANQYFSVSSGIGLNYKLANMTTDVNLVRPFFGKGLDSGWCVNYKSEKPGYLGGLGFDLARVHHVSLWDRLAPTRLKETMFGLQTTGPAVEWTFEGQVGAASPGAVGIMELLRSADVIIINGGNPDFVKYVFTEFAPEVLEPLRSKVASGTAVLVGESAGAMVASADVGLTYQPAPQLQEVLSHGSVAGMALSGKCAIRPHDSGAKWALASAVYGKLKHLNVVMLPNGEALHCVGADCHVVGATGRLGESFFTGPNDPGLARLTDAFRTAGV